MRKYTPIWKAIKAAKTNEEVKIKCRTAFAATLRQGVMKEKSRETAQRKKLGLPYAGKLIIRTEAAGDAVAIYFKLDWDGTKI